MEYTKEQVKFNIATDVKWLEKAIVVIYTYQTMDEKHDGETKHNNGVGFNGCDSKALSYYARYINSGGHLTGKHLERARKLMPKYAGQILELIKTKTKRRNHERVC